MSGFLAIEWDIFNIIIGFLFGAIFTGIIGGTR